MKITAQMTQEAAASTARPTELGIHFTPEFDTASGTHLTKLHVPNPSNPSDTTNGYGNLKTLAALRREVILGYWIQLPKNSKGANAKVIDFVNSNYDTKDLVLARFRPGTDEERAKGKIAWNALKAKSSISYVTKSSKDLEAWLNA